MVIGIASPAGAGLPAGRAAAAHVAHSGAASIPVTGIPVLVFHGPIATRAALGFTPDGVLVRPLAPLVPSVRLSRDQIADIELEDGHWYAFGRRVVCIRRTKGPVVRLMSPPLPGIADSTDTLYHLLRAWWRSRGVGSHE